MRKIFKWEYTPSGNCPVQANGWFLGYYFYFRARWSSATIEFYNDKGDYEVDIINSWFKLIETEEYKAGWLSNRKCKLLIYKGCFKFMLKLFITLTQNQLRNQK